MARSFECNFFSLINDLYLLVRFTHQLSIPNDCSDLSHKPVSIHITDKIPCYKKAIYWICGIENMSNSSKNRKGMEPIEMDMSIAEDSTQSTAVNVMAIILMIGTAFMWGYYA